MHRARTACGLSIAILGVAGLELANAAGQPRTGVDLFRNGTPLATIVTAPKPSATVELAVAELQYHLARITGSRLPRRTDVETLDGTLVLVGESKLTRARGLTNERFERQEFLVETRENVLVLIGRDHQVFGRLRYADDLTLHDKFGYVRHYDHPHQRFPLYPGWTKWDAIGTAYAVYEFLERICGVRWYLPGADGMYVPRRRTLSVPPVRIRRKPWMIYREGTAYEKPAPKRLYWWDRNEKITPDDALPWRDTQLWVLRNKGWGSAFIANHSYVHWHKRFLDTHPDWFVDKPHPAWKRLGRELCLTHPGVRAQMIKDIDDFFGGLKEMPEAKNAYFRATGDYFSITPNDHSQRDDLCHCPRCRPLLGYPGTTSNLTERDREFSYGSRLVWSFIVDIAQEVEQTHPGKYISALAYPFFLYPPPGMRNPQNLAVMVTLQPSGAFQYCPAFRKSRERLLTEWGRHAGQLFVWLYSVYPQYGTGERFPALIYTEFSRQMRFFHEHNVRGFFDDMDSRLTLTVDALGGRTVPVWPNPMEDVFRHYIVLKMADRIDIDAEAFYDEFFVNWYGQAARPIKDFVRDAQRLHNDPAFVLDGVPQPQGYIPERSVGKGWQQAIWAGVCTEKDLARLGGHVAAAYEAADTPQARAHVELFDKAIYQGIVSGRAKWIPPRARKGLRKRAVCPRLETNVTGGLASVPWSDAIQLSPFLPHRRLPVISPNLDPRASAPNRTDVRMLRDADKLYFTLRCFQAEDATAGAGTDDVVELFFAPDGTGDFYQVMVDSSGRVRTYSSRDKWKWNAHAEVVVEKGASAWTAMLIIPLRAFSDRPLRAAFPVAGDMWRFNVTRSLREWTVLSAWSPAVGGWRNPEYFGELWFSVLRPDQTSAASEPVRWQPLDIQDPRWRDGHSTWTAEGVDAAFSCDESIKHSGAHSFRVVNESDRAGSAIFLARVMDLGNAAAIRASSWVRTENAIVAIGMRFRDSRGEYLSTPAIRGDRFEGTTDWTRISVVAEKIPEDAARVDIHLTCRRGTAWFDDVAAEKATK